MSASNPISERRLAANRANAQKSTGPRTADGKATVSLNAMKHGFRAEKHSAGLGDSAPAATRGVHARFVAQLRRDVRPRGALQEILFDRVATLAWQLKRLRQTQRAIIHDDRRRRFAPEHQDEPAKSDGQIFAQCFVRCDEPRNHHVYLRRYEASTERSFYRALTELRKLQQADDGGDDESLDADDENLHEQTHRAESDAATTLGPEVICEGDDNTPCAEQSRQTQRSYPSQEDLSDTTSAPLIQHAGSSDDTNCSI